MLGPAHGFALSLLLWFEDPPSVPASPAADAMSKRLNGAPRSRGLRWRKVSHLQTYSGHQRGIKPQTPSPREEWMNLRENSVRKLQDAFGHWFTMSHVCLHSHFFPGPVSTLSHLDGLHYHYCCYRGRRLCPSVKRGLWKE